MFNSDSRRKLFSALSKLATQSKHHRAFSFVNKNAIKHEKMPFFVISHSFRSPYVVKTVFEAFVH